MPIININNRILIRTKALKTASTFHNNVCSQTSIMRLLYNGGKVIINQDKVYIKLNNNLTLYHVGYLDPQYSSLYKNIENKEVKYRITGGIPYFQVEDGVDYFIHHKFGLNLEIDCYDID